jgi:hypothetical protein
MGRFAGLNSAQGSQGGVYFEPGNYRIIVQRCKDIETRHGKPAFIVECEIKGSDVAALPAGAKPSWFVDLSQDAAEGNIADFLRTGLRALAVAKGQDPDAVLADYTSSNDKANQYYDAVVDESNIFAGLELQVYAFNIKTRAGSDFTKLQWLVPAAGAPMPTVAATAPAPAAAPTPTTQQSQGGGLLV